MFMKLTTGIRRLTRFDVAQKTFKATQDFIQPYILEHKQTLDPDNIRDFVDLMLCEIENTTNPESSFYGETGTKGYQIPTFTLSFIEKLTIFEIVTKFLQF